MPSTVDRVVALARGMRALVRARAGESERARTLTRAIVDEMWSSGLISALNPVAAGGGDRHDRAGGEMLASRRLSRWVAIAGTGRFCAAAFQCQPVLASQHPQQRHQDQPPDDVTDDGVGEPVQPVGVAEG